MCVFNCFVVFSRLKRFFILVFILFVGVLFVLVIVEWICFWICWGFVNMLMLCFLLRLVFILWFGLVVDIILGILVYNGLGSVKYFLLILLLKCCVILCVSFRCCFWFLFIGIVVVWYIRILVVCKIG